MLISTQNKKNFSIPLRDCLGPDDQGTAIPAHSEKIAKMALFNPWMKFKFYLAQGSFLSAKIVSFRDFIQIVSQGSGQVLIQVDKSRWIGLSQESLAQIKTNIFV